MDEFAIIKKYFHSASTQPTVVLGPGDDCALVTVPPGQQLAITMDTLVSGVHFAADAAAYDIGYKALAVSLSDLAAMGATPAWMTGALTLPQSDEKWLHDFSRGLIDLAQRYKIELIGGDLTHGPLSITIQAHGFVPAGLALTRSNAKVNDLIYVTNTLGDARLGLEILSHKITVADKFHEKLLSALHRPEPRINVGLKIQDVAHAAIDISDGLAGDLNHILEMSQVGAVMYVDKLPLSEALRQSVSIETAWDFALNGGDDYELCFTVPPENVNKIQAIAAETDCTLTCIGKIIAEKILDLQFEDGKKYHGKIAGYQHF